MSRLVSFGPLAHVRGWIRAFRDTFEKLEAVTDPTRHFSCGMAQSVYHRYRPIYGHPGHGIHYCIDRAGMGELDTAEDYQRLQSIAERQRLETLVRQEAEISDAK